MDKFKNNEPVIGIIAEYNPLHNGHALHLSEVKKILPDAPVVVVLSSNFTQRGIPSIVDKWTRSEMALASGADLVLELPFVFACDASPGFSTGAVGVLSKTNFITHLSFGAEDAKYNTEPILNILMQEPDSFKSVLKQYLSEGQSYPKALAGALEHEYPGCLSFVSSPNNSLGLSYLLQAKKQAFNIVPLPVTRMGGGYHELTRGVLASATAIRASLTDDEYNSEWLNEAMPASSLRLLSKSQVEGRICIGTEKLWSLLRGLLLRTPASELRRYSGMDEGIENLFLKHYSVSGSYDDFIGRCVCARYTRSRLQRQCIRLLAGLERSHASDFMSFGPSYIRVLGYNDKGRKLLRTHGKNASVPIITRLASVKGEMGRKMAEMEFRASKLYELLLPSPDLCYEERQKPRSL